MSTDRYGKRVEERVGKRYGKKRSRKPVGIYTNPEGDIDARGGRVVNVAPPLNQRDAITMEYLDSWEKRAGGPMIIPNDPEQEISFDKRRVTGLPEPLGSSDPATKFFVERNTMMLDKDITGFSAKFKKVIDLEGPENSLDAVNLKYLEERLAQRNGLPRDENEYDAGGLQIKRLGAPTEKDDASTKEYIDERVEGIRH